MRALVPWMALGLGLTLSACGGSAAERMFMHGCEQNGVPESVCKCTYGKLMERYTEDEIQSMYVNEDRRKLGRFMNDMVLATRACMR